MMGLLLDLRGLTWQIACILLHVDGHSAQRSGVNVFSSVVSPIVGCSVHGCCREKTLGHVF